VVCYLLLVIVATRTNRSKKNYRTDLIDLSLDAAP
jgi:hypothetical protein